MPNTKPYVAAACVVERVLIEPDSVVSLIRIVDTYHLDIPEPLPQGFRAALSVTVFVAVKSGDVTGQHEIGLVLRKPNGQTGEPQKWPVVFTGGEQGANLKLDFNLVGEPGQSPALGCIGSTCCGVTRC